MSLRVWLPLNGNLDNQGLDDVTPVLTGAVAVDNEGKIGKCYKFGTSLGRITVPPAVMRNYTECSVTFWVNILGWQTNWDTFFQAGLGSTPWNSYIFGVLRNSGNSVLFTISDASSSSQGNYKSSDLTLNTWYHLGFTYKSGHCCIYVNGNLYKDYSTNIIPNFSGINYISLGQVGNASSYQTNCKMNDFRIYDHCLSPLEVKQISQGLILHYPLNRNGWGQENLLKNTKVSVTDGSKTGFVLSQTIPSGTKVTFSLQVDATDLVLSGNKRIGLEGFQNNGTNNSYKGVWISGASAQGTYSKRISATVTLDRDFLANNNTFGIYIQTTSSGTVTISNPKIEIGDKVTPWCPNSSDELATTLGLNDNVEYDTSGYGNNGTRTGTFSWTSDTPKYNISTYMPKESLITHPCPVFSGINQEWTCAMWVKLNITNQSQILMNNFNAGNSIVHQANSYPLLYLNDGSDDYYMYGSQIVNAEEWTHVVFVFKNSEGLRNIYINGELTNNYGPNKTSTPRGIPDTVIIGTNLKGYISDYRIYCTALSAQDVKSLYNNSAYIDNQGNLYGAILREV